MFSFVSLSINFSQTGLYVYDALNFRFLLLRVSFRKYRKFSLMLGGGEWADWRNHVSGGLCLRCRLDAEALFRSREDLVQENLRCAPRLPGMKLQGLIALKRRTHESQEAEGAQRQDYRRCEEEDGNRNRLEKGVQETGQEEVKKKRHKTIDPAKARKAAIGGLAVNATDPPPEECCGKCEQTPPEDVPDICDSCRTPSTKPPLITP